MEGCNSSSSEEEEYIYPSNNGIMHLPAVKPSPPARFDSSREVATSDKVSRKSALKEHMEAVGQSYIDENLGPLVKRRQNLERLERVLGLQLKWSTLFQHTLSLSWEHMHEGYGVALNALAKEMVLAYGDYIKERTSMTKEERCVVLLDFLYLCY